MRKVALKPWQIAALCTAVTIQVAVIIFFTWDRTPPELTPRSKQVDYDTTLSVGDIIDATDNRSKTVALAITGVNPSRGVTIQDDATSAQFSYVGSYTVDVIGTDRAGNKTEAFVTVQVNDTTPPVLSAPENDVEVGYAESFTVGISKSYDVTVLAEDKTNVTSQITGVAAEDFDINRSDYKISSDGKKLAISKIGTYDVSLSVVDEFNNESTTSVRVVVTDKTSPELHLKSEYILGEDDEAPNYLKGVKAIDEIDGDITDNIVVDSLNVSYGVVGDYKVTYSVTDKAGNKESKSVPVHIKDTTPPVITLAETSLSLTEGDSAPNYLSMVSAVDEIDGDMTSSITVDDSEVDYDTPGTYEVTYRIADNSGNAVTKTASVTIKGKPSPTTTVSVGSGGGYTVYITDTGEKYHTSSCRYLRKSKHPISKSEAVSRGYEPCSVCDP